MKRLTILTLIVMFLISGVGFAQISPELNKKMDNADSEYLPVIVEMKEQINVANLTRSLDLRGDEQAVTAQLVNVMKDQAERSQYWLKSYCNQRDSQVKDFQTFWITNMVSMKATAAAIREMAQRPEVEMIFLDEPQQFVSYIEGVPTRSAWGLAKIKSTELNAKGIDGEGIVVAVIDTGVNYNHNDLKGRVIKGKDTVNNDMDPLDDNGHGSHCAGTVAGTKYGVAPKVKILAVKVLSGSGSGSWSGVAAGVQYVADYKASGKSLHVASMSLGGRAPIQSVLRNAFDNAVNLGIRFAVAAGNSGPSSSTIGTPGDQKDVASIGATDINDNIAYFSSRGPVTAYGASYIKPDVSAPGVNITSCWKGGSTATKTISGTSMATPHVAGLMALMMQVNPNLDFFKVRDILESTSLEMGAKGKDNVFGSGRVQADKAVAKVRMAREFAENRFEIEKEINFPIAPDGSIEVNMVKENPLWEMEVKVDITILNPEGKYDGQFSLIKSGKSEQKGSLSNVSSGQQHFVGTYTIYDGENTLQFKGKYSGSSKATEGTLRIRARAVR